MDRQPEHIVEDPNLRLEFIGQESLDEFAERLFSNLETNGNFDVVAALKSVGEGAYHPDLYGLWRDSLDGNTTQTEVIYLEGYTDKAARKAVIDQRHARLREAALKSGLFTWEDLEKARKEE